MVELCLISCAKFVKLNTKLLTDTRRRWLVGVLNEDEKLVKERLMPRAIRQMKACDERC